MIFESKISLRQIRLFLLISLMTICFSANSQGKYIINDSNSPYIISNDTSINKGDTLIVGPGAEVVIADSVNVEVKGLLLIQGTPNKKAIIRPLNPGIGWGVIRVDNKVDTLIIENTIIEDGRIISSGTVNYYQNVTFINNQNLEWNHAISRFVRGKVFIDNCYIYGINKGEGILCHQIDSPLISNSYFNSIPDAVELIDSDGGRITKCEFTDIRDDAIDLNNCNRIIIDSNIIINAWDRGMEIGSENRLNSTNIHLYRNVVVNCKSGINFKNGSTGLIENNTIVGNQKGISLLAEIDSNRATYVEVINCIFDQNIIPIFNDVISNYKVTYSSSSSILFGGEGNIFEDLLFVDLNAFNFNLDSSSRCIDSGSRNGKFDPDGSVLDMGAHYFPQKELVQNFSITKIGPNPAKDFLIIETTDVISSLKIFDSNGSLKLEKEVNIGNYDSSFKLDISMLTSGYYILILKGSNSVRKEKFVKINSF